MTVLTHDGLEIPDGEAKLFAVYRNPGTSEVSGEERTLCGAMAKHAPSRGAEVICRGVVHARARYDGGWLVSPEGYFWSLTSEGASRLAEEHELLLQRWRK
jgi:hypothetical protein